MNENEKDFYILKIVDNSLNRIFFELNEEGKSNYTCVDKDIPLFRDINTEDEMDFIIIKFEKKRSENGKEKYKPLQIYLTKAEYDGDKDLKISYLASTSSCINVENFCNSIFLDLQHDFDAKSYLTTESNFNIFAEFSNELLNKEREDFKNSEIDVNFSDMGIDFKNIAQQSGECIRVKKEEDTKRSPYERDKDRIIHSKAFRRLVDKAQIFTSKKGDHYRTRMTHTLEVTQIARSIARQLNLNEDLTEAIALAHDLGHTPFGHQGERTLDHILSGESTCKTCIKNIEIEAMKQNFKHNFQTLRTLTLLELKYPELPGLNMSYQVMEGAWKHTDIGGIKVDEFFNYGDLKYLYCDYKHATTLEGQVVAIADEIAQRSHDIDDAFKSHKIDNREILKYSKGKKLKKLSEIIEDIAKHVDEVESKKHIIFIDKHDMFRARLCSRIIDYFISDVIKTSKENITNCSNNKLSKEHRYSEKLIDCSEEAKMISKGLNKLIIKKVIYSSEVKQFDCTSERIIKKLFIFVL